MSEDVWFMLVDRHDVQRKLFDKKVFGDDMKNYLLYDGINKNRFSNNLTKACNKANVRHHSGHDSRHTGGTNLCGKTKGNLFFAQLVLGHRDSRETEG